MLLESLQEDACGLRLLWSVFGIFGEASGGYWVARGGVGIGAIAGLISAQLPEWLM
jgi:hypothetical protein